MSKIIEKLIKTRMLSLMSNNILSKRQFGLQEKISTSNAFKILFSYCNSYHHLVVSFKGLENLIIFFLFAFIAISLNLIIVLILSGSINKYVNALN